MPTVLTSGDREDVKSRLRAGPTFQQDPPIMLKVTITWITATLTSFLNFISLFLGVISDDLTAVTNCVIEIEANMLQALAPVSTASTRRQEPCPSIQTRCKWCDALGHNTTDCHTKDPVAVKKRVGNNQRAHKCQVMQLPPLTWSGFYPPPFPPQPPSFSPIAPDTLLMATIAEVKKLRCWKTQSTWDKHRGGVVPKT